MRTSMVQVPFALSPSNSMMWLWDARRGHPLFQSGIELIELLAAAHLDIGLLADDLINKAAVIGEQILDLGALAARHRMRVLGGQFLDLLPILDLLDSFTNPAGANHEDIGTLEFFGPLQERTA